MPGRLSCELPAIPGCPDQYAIAGDSHQGARNACVSTDRRVPAISRNCTDSLRRSTRRAYSSSPGQSRASQSRNTGYNDNRNATHTAVRDLIGSSNAGRESANINTKKYAQRASQTVSKYVATNRTTMKTGRSLFLFFVRKLSQS